MKKLASIQFSPRSVPFLLLGIAVLTYGLRLGVGQETHAEQGHKGRCQPDCMERNLIHEDHEGREV